MFNDILSDILEDILTNNIINIVETATYLIVYN